MAQWEGWRSYLAESLEASPARALAESVDRLRRAGAFDDAESAAYWTYHLVRCGFFFTQGLVSIALSNLAGVDTSRSVGFDLRAPSTLRFNPAALVNEAMSVFKQDLRWIKAGAYKMPWDMTTPGNRQNNPVSVLGRSLDYFAEATRVMGQREAGVPKPLWMDSGLYPEYYTNTFHFQTDGWMSSASARVYETSTETLFLGRQDAMQRLGLVGLGDHLRRRGIAASDGLEILEVAAGTGRYATFLRDNHPHANVTISELSPFYLEEARANHRAWEALRGQGARGRARFVQAPAEALPFPDASFDAVSCTYLFHEIPRDVRLAAMREAARVLRPGGAFVLVDSIQLGDRPDRDERIGRFGAFNEPFYADYIRTDLAALGREAGLEPSFKAVSSASKLLTFTKP